MPRTDRLLPEGAKQEEAQQSPLVLQRLWPVAESQRYVELLSLAESRSPVRAVCVLLDVGTKPTGTSIYELWKGPHTNLLHSTESPDRV